MDSQTETERLSGRHRDIQNIWTDRETERDLDVRTVGQTERRMDRRTDKGRTDKQ
jgi:hypothetical protein